MFVPNYMQLKECERCWIIEIREASQDDQDGHRMRSLELRR